jgi:hypothetical protein
MTRRTDAHLSADDIDAWLAGHLGPAEAAHLEACPACLDWAEADQALIRQLRALDPFSPSPLFADHVMAAVSLPDPFALRSLGTVRRRLVATRRSVALAAMVALVVLGSMTASIVWSLAHRDVIAGAGTWLTASAGQWLWTALRSTVSSVIEQPGYHGLRDLAGSPGRLAALSALVSLTYVGGLLALRKLMAVPSGPVSHANA